MLSRRLLSGVRVACLGVIGMVAVGCGPSGPTTVSITGKVTVDGQPLSDCRIDFQPISSECQAASGQINADGTYTLYTGTTGTPGAMVGKYKVVIVPNAGADTSYMDSGTEPSGAPEAGDGKVPKEYTDASTTPKEVEVTSGSTTIDIEIEASSPPS